MGAPAKTIDMTTAGVPLAAKASSTPNAPKAPTAPANRDQLRPFMGKCQVAPCHQSKASGAKTAVKK